MLNICDVDIFDQNLSSADSAIDTECDDIIFWQNLRFVISHSQKYCKAIKKFAKRPNMHCRVQFNPDTIVSYAVYRYIHMYILKQICIDNYHSLKRQNIEQDQYHLCECI